MGFAIETERLLSVSRRAMACPFEILIPAEVPQATDAAQSALDAIDRFEDQLTVYRHTSEVSRLNAIAEFAPVPVEENLYDLLSLCARIHEETAGAFDITAGALIKAWGFFRGPRRVPSATEIADALAHVGMQNVLLDAEKHSVHYRRRGLEINLGSIGKGYALDRAAHHLRRDWRIESGLLHGGYSSVLAIGSPEDDPRGWTVGICDPRNPSYRVAEIRLNNRALGTSAVTFQHLEHEGRKLGHILDPRTGWPAEGMQSVSIAAPTAALADALATAFFILGVEKTREYCDAHPEIGVLLIPAESDQESLRVICLGRLDANVFPSPVLVGQTGTTEYDDG